MLKEQKGITLVALIITIIVMLILAGVSISLVVGENGVLTQAENAGTAMNAAAAKQTVDLALADLMARYYANTAGATTLAEKAKVYSVANLADAIKDNGGVNVDMTGASDDATTGVLKTASKVVVDGYEITLTKDVSSSTVPKYTTSEAVAK